MKRLFLFSIALTVLLFVNSCDLFENCLVPELLSPIDNAQATDIQPLFTWDAPDDVDISYVLETSESADFSTRYNSMQLRGNSIQDWEVYPHNQTFHWRLSTNECDEVPKTGTFKTQNYITFLSGDYQSDDASQVLTFNQIADESMSFTTDCGDVYFDMDDLMSWDSNGLMFYYKDNFTRAGIDGFMELEILYKIQTKTLHIDYLHKETTNGQVTLECSYSFSGTKI